MYYLSSPYSITLRFLKGCEFKPQCQQIGDLEFNLALPACLRNPDSIVLRVVLKLFSGFENTQGKHVLSLMPHKALYLILTAFSRGLQAEEFINYC